MNDYRQIQPSSDRLLPGQPSAGRDTSKNLIEETAEDAVSVMEDFVRSLIHSGVQSPLQGVAQLVNHVAEKKVIGDGPFMKPPEQAEYGSINWHAQTIGGALGMVAPFFLVSRGIRAGAGALARVAGIGRTAETIGLLSRPITQVGLSIAEAGAAGVVTEGLMKPVQGESKDFWSNRGHNAAVGGLTFAAIGGLAGGLRARVAGVAPEAGYGMLGRNAGIGVFSGLGGGLVHAEADSWLSGKGWASTRDVVQSAYTFAIAGGALGALHGPAKSAESTPSQFYSRSFQADVGLVPVEGRAPVSYEAFQASGAATLDLPLFTAKPAVEWTPPIRAVEQTPQPRPVEQPLPQRAVEQALHPSLKQVTTKPGAVKVYEYWNGDVVTIKPNGMEVTEKANGEVHRLRPDGTATINYPNGTRVTYQTDGVEVKQLPNGETVTTLLNGTEISRFPNGEVHTLYRDGTAVIKYPDGREVWFDPITSAPQD